MNRLQHFPESAGQHIDHPAHAKHGIHPLPARLHVVTMMSNPLRWRSRYNNYWRFAKHMEDSGAILYTAEIAYGDRRYEVTEPDNLRHLQLNSRHELWHKENALNLLIQRLPREAEYIAWIDADVMFARPDWAQETLHALQHYDFVQPFTTAHDLDINDQVLNSMTSFLYRYLHDRPAPHDPCYTNVPLPKQCTGANASDGYWHPGYAWAARRDALEKVGGLIDWAIMGSADWHMAWALVGNVEPSLSPGLSETYKALTREWARRCNLHIRKNVGVLPGSLFHWHHGCKTKRAYGDRWKFIINTKFCPNRDIKRDCQGLWQLTDDNSVLRDGIRQYARERHEDS